MKAFTKKDLILELRLRQKSLKDIWGHICSLEDWGVYESERLEWTILNIQANLLQSRISDIQKDLSTDGEGDKKI